MSKATAFFLFIILLNIFSILIFDKHKSYDKSNVIIKPGMNLEEISEELFSKKIIKNSNLFKIWVKLSFSETKLRFEIFFRKK